MVEPEALVRLAPVSAVSVIGAVWTYSIASKTVDIQNGVQQKKANYERLRRELDEKPDDEKLFKEIKGIFGQAGSRPIATTP